MTDFVFPKHPDWLIPYWRDVDYSCYCTGSEGEIMEDGDERLGIIVQRCHHCKALYWACENSDFVFWDFYDYLPDTVGCNSCRKQLMTNGSFWLIQLHEFKEQLLLQVLNAEAEWNSGDNWGPYGQVKDVRPILTDDLNLTLPKGF